MADRNRFRNNTVYIDYHLFICLLVEQEYMGGKTSQSWDRAFSYIDVNRDFQFLLGKKTMMMSNSNWGQR